MTLLAQTSVTNGDYCGVATAYHPAVVAQFKAMPGCTYAPASKTWHGPIEAVDEVLATLERARVLIRGGATVSLPQPPLPEVFVEESGLYEHQKVGVRFMLDSCRRRGAALLADDMGLGKSAQAARVVAALDQPTVLVLCPAVVVPHWREQFARWGIGATEQLGRKIHGKRFTNFGLRTGTVRTAIASYDTFRSLATSRDVTLPAANIIVLDELHYLSSPKARRSKVVREYVARSRRCNDSIGEPCYVIGLTGTPMTARPRDLWHPLDLLFPGRFGPRFKFEQRYCDGRWEEIRGLEKPVWSADGQSNLAELGRRLQALMLRRVKGDVLDLPERQRIVIPVELPAAARRAVAQTATVLGLDRDIGKALSAVEEHKMTAAVELASSLAAQGRRPLLFTLRRDTAHQLAEKLGAPCVTGEDDVSQRRERLVGAPIGVATVYSVTTGIDLTAFDTIIFVGLDWVPSTLLQAEARIHRIGQDKNVLFYYLVGLGTVDEVVRAKVLERLDNFAEVVGNSPDEVAMARTLRGSKSDEELLAEIVASVLEGA